MVTKYQPSAYEEMLLAAGWVTMADLDDEFIEYKQATDFDFSYETWIDMREQWDALNRRYTEEVDPFYQQDWTEPIPAEVVKLGNDLMKQMMRLEVALGY